MQTYARYTGTCTYCLDPIEADATPKTDRGFAGPLNVNWFHVYPGTSAPVDEEPDHDAVPRGRWDTVPNSERFTVDPYGDVVTLQVPMGVLEVGHQFVGNGGDTAFEVTSPCRDHRNGWLATRRVLLIGVPCPACTRRGEVTQACEECGGCGEAGHGVWSDRPETAVYLITDPPVGP